MKTELELAREQINEIDDQMIELFKKRMNAVKIVAEYKIENNIPVLDTKRELEQKIMNLGKLDSKELEEYYLEFFEGVLSSSKNFQKHLINTKK